MALKQYIGARYVTKIYENSLDPLSAEWEADVNYEPLTMVTFNFGSYLSKKDVPATVGNPSDNPEYWVQTGFYNGQIAYLYDQVTDLNTSVGNIGGDITDINNAIHDIQGDITNIEIDIANLFDKRVVVISDSYGLVRGGNTPFTTTLQTLLGLSNDDYFTYSEGSMGINRTGDQGHTTISLLQAHASDITDHDTITDIIIAMGANDTLATSGLDAAIDTLCTYIKTTYPKAKIHLGFIGNTLTKNGSDLANYLSAVASYKSGAGRNGANYIKGVEYIMHNARFAQSDGVHPTTAGCNEIAYFINAYINGSAYDYSIAVQITASGAKVTQNSCVINQYLNGGNATTRCTIRTAANIALDGTTLVEIATLDDPVINGIAGFVNQMEALAYISGDYVPVVLAISGGKVYVKANAYTGGGTIAANTSITTTVSPTTDTLLI